MLQSSQSSFKAGAGTNAGGAAPNQRLGAAGSVVNSSIVVNAEDKPKGGEFPLDHILPVFNLNKKDSSFIPTLKFKQKDQSPLGSLSPPKRKQGVVRGTTVHKAASRTVDEPKAKQNALSVGAAAQAPAPPGPKVAGATPGVAPGALRSPQSVGLSFRE